MFVYVVIDVEFEFGFFIFGSGMYVKFREIGFELVFRVVVIVMRDRVVGEF